MIHSAARQSFSHPYNDGYRLELGVSANSLLALLNAINNIINAVMLLILAGSLSIYVYKIG